ncbi:hypothetical protein O7543_28940 [Solwaraspora sp. WMMA2080]|uniref:hypothetical protein n=1 Tax=unclassified Solwaraspora TaxID=2627926 RepID=UPI00248B5190|nr:MULTISPECIES: hypothetical protein [unclassified Solwaraspora]WBB95362.1 hypothetical protein O7553_18420 [Solwaraspora sp. WMMA2059]WBC20732.1 hypothetical protein O7543_28940 [Solwaraspora sp. WMMA2080]
MWSLFRRSARLPADQRPPLDRDERLLAWSGTATGTLVVTNRGLWLPGRDTRLGWHQVHKAVWSGERLVVTPAETVSEHDGYTVVADGPAISLDLSDPGDVPDQVRTRVTRSVGYSMHHQLDGGGARVVGRRVSGIDGLSWTVRYDASVDTDADWLPDRTAELVAAARASVEQQP